MKCSKCDYNLEENAKFCYKCGTPVDESSNFNGNQETQIPPVANEGIPTPQQSFTTNTNGTPPQQFYSQSTNGFPQQVPYNTMSSPNTDSSIKTIKTICAVIIIALLAVIFILYSKVNDLESTVANYENLISDYENAIYNYENRSTLDKTQEAVESWMEYFY